MEFTNSEKTLLSTMREGVIERGEDYVYPFFDEDKTCLYNQYSEPGNINSRIIGVGCIVGYALINSEADTPERLRSMEGQSARVVLDIHRHDISNNFAEAIKAAQIEQDSGHSWGKAYNCALDSLYDDGYDVSQYRL